MWDKKKRKTEGKWKGQRQPPRCDTKQRETRGTRWYFSWGAEPNKFLTKTADSPRYASFLSVSSLQPAGYHLFLFLSSRAYSVASYRIHLPEIQMLMVFRYYRDIYALPPMPDNIIHVDTCYSILAACWYNTRQQGREAVNYK